jgi:hypothetical protein
VFCSNHLTQTLGDAFATVQGERANVGKKLIELHHPLDGVTNPKDKLLCLLATDFFYLK